jgi:membrane associated rhomboid family serine protease
MFDNSPSVGRPVEGNDEPQAKRWLLVIIIVFCAVIEILLQFGDLGLLGSRRMRALAYEYAGFWPGLLRDWGPNYPLQPYVMFVSYGFLHSGLVHLVINMLTLWSLGTEVIRRVGLRGFTLLYGTSIIGGAFGFALLSSGVRPMVGASGALFGLAGGLLAWLYVDRYSNQEKLLPVAQAVILLILLNLFLWWAMQGQLAWETHLGGFLVGWMAALLVDPRPRTAP